MSGLSQQVFIVSKEDLELVIKSTISPRLDVLEEVIKGGDEFGRIGGIELAQEITGLSINRIRALMSKRNTNEGIPCMKVRNRGVLFSSVAIKRWLLGEDCQKLTLWMEGFRKGI